MTEIKITVSLPALEQAIGELADAIRTHDGTDAPKKVTGVSSTPVGVAAPQDLTAQEITVPVKVKGEKEDDGARTSEAEAAKPAPSPEPKKYTLDDLANAAAALIDAHGKEGMDKVMALIQTYGVPAINLLKEDQFGSFAEGLRAIGGKI